MDAILRAYREEISLGSKTVHFMNPEKLESEVLQTISWTRRMRTFTEDDDVNHELYAVDEPEAIEDEEAENEEGDVRPLPRERPFSLEQLVKRAHAGLGHPSNDKLARILQQAKAGSDPDCQESQVCSMPGTSESCRTSSSSTTTDPTCERDSGGRHGVVTCNQWQATDGTQSGGLV